MSEFEVVRFDADPNLQYWQDAYTLITTEVYQDPEPDDIDEVTEVAQKRCGTFYGIVPDQQASLAAMGAIARERNKDNYAEIVYLATQPESRGRGYGSYLLTLFERTVQGQGAAGVYLFPTRRAVGFYEKYGYREGPDEHWYKELA